MPGEAAPETNQACFIRRAFCDSVFQIRSKDIEHAEARSSRTPGTAATSLRRHSTSAAFGGLRRRYFARNKPIQPQAEQQHHKRADADAAQDC